MEREFYQSTQEPPNQQYFVVFRIQNIPGGIIRLDFRFTAQAINFAEARWAATASGDGDGQWTSSGGSRAYATVLAAAPTVADEPNLFWWHLRLAGFIPGTTAAGAAAGTPPSNAVNGILGVQTGAGANTLGFASNIVCSSNLPDKIASAVDTQIDDGVMQTGLVRSSGPQTTPSPALATLPGGTTTYVENGTNQYTICKQL